MRSFTTDEFFIEASQRVIARALLDLSEDARWWPGARASGEYGWVEVSAPVGRLRPRVHLAARIGPVREWESFTWFLERGEVRGRGEWWLEAFKSGTIVHYFVDVQPGDRGRFRRMSSRVRRHRWAVRRGLNGLKDVLEARPPVSRVR